MNKLDGRELFDKIRHNETYSKNASLLAQNRAVLQQMDTTKTRVWGLLSQDFFEHGNPCEIRAFYDFIANKFILRDFNRPFEKIAEKVNRLFELNEGNLLEYILLDNLIRQSVNNDSFRFRKGASESDIQNKSDLIINYSKSGNKYNLGVQLTILKDNLALFKKKNQVKNITTRIDSGINNPLLQKTQLIDTLMFVDFFGYYATKKSSNNKQLKSAFIEWQNNSFNGNIIDYISKERLKNEIISFCKTLPMLVDRMFELISKNIGKINSLNGRELLPNGVEIKYYYDTNFETIEVMIYHKPKELLFRLNFFINKTLMQKLNPQTY